MRALMSLYSLSSILHVADEVTNKFVGKLKVYVLSDMYFFSSPTCEFIIIANKRILLCLVKIFILKQGITIIE